MQTCSVIASHEAGQLDKLSAITVECLLNLFRAILKHMFVLGEEILVDSSPAKQPNIAIVRYGAVGEINCIEKRALCFCLHWCHNVRHAKETKQLLTLVAHPLTY